MDQSNMPSLSPEDEALLESMEKDKGDSLLIQNFRLEALRRAYYYHGNKLPSLRAWKKMVGS